MPSILRRQFGTRRLTGQPPKNYSFSTMNPLRVNPMNQSYRQEIINFLETQRYPRYSDTIELNGIPIFDTSRWIRNSDEAIRLYNEMMLHYRGGKTRKSRKTRKTRKRN